MSVCVFFKVRSQLCACCSTPSPNFACMHVVFSLLYHVSVWRHGWARRRRAWRWTPSTTAAVHALVPQPPPSPTLLRPRAAAALRASRRGAGRTKTSMRAKQAVVLLARTRERRGELGNLRWRRQGASEPTRPPLSSSRQGILAMYTRPAGWLPLTSYSECYCLLECNLT